MNNIIKQIEVDVYSPTFYEVIKAQQGDKNSRFVEFILFNQGEPYTIPNDITVNLEGSRPNKSPIIKPCTIKDNVITIELDADLLYYHGIYRLKLVLYEADGNTVLSTIPFTLSVQKNPLDSDKFEKDNYSLLNQLILESVANTKKIDDHINDSDNPHTIIYEEAESLSKLTAGEKLSDTFGKLSKAVSDLISHINNNICHITSTERENWDDAYSKRHIHSNKSILDKVTQTLLDKWNAAYSHISDTIMHITSTERTLWNTVNNKVAKNGDTMTGVLYNTTPYSDERTTSMSSEGFYNHVPHGDYAGGMNWVDQDGNEIGTVGLFKDNYFYIGKDFQNTDGILKLNKVIGDLKGTSDYANRMRIYQSKNTGNNTNMWYKACTLSLKQQYDDSFAHFIVVQNGTGDNNIDSMEVFVRLKQQKPMGQEPCTSLKVTNCIGRMISGDVAMHISKNDTTETILDIYCRIKHVYGFQSVISIYATSLVTFLEKQELLSNLPTGICAMGQLEGKVLISEASETLQGHPADRFTKQYNNTPQGDEMNPNEICTLGNNINAMLTSAIDNPTKTAGWYHIWSQSKTKSPDNWVSQIAIDVQKSSGMYYRNSLADQSIVGRPWVKLLDEKNFYDYIKTATGLKNIKIGDYLANKSWIDAGEITTKPEYFLRAYRVDSSSKQEWIKNDWGSALIFGGHDVRGCISISHYTPGIKLAGGNKNSVWNMEITGTKGKVYNLETIQNTISDERDKTDFEPINRKQALEFIKNLKPLSFVSNMRDNYSKNTEDFTEEEWDNYSKYGFKPYDKEAHLRGDKKGERRRVGVSAQETIKVLEKIYGSSDVSNIVNDNLHGFDKISDEVENQYSITYENFIPYLISAIQELSDIVKEQTHTIEQLSL